MVAYNPLSDPPEKIVADTKRYREDAMQQLAAIEAGKSVPAMDGRTRDEAVRILTENIEIYETTMRM